MMDLIRFSLIISFLLSVNCIKVKRLIATSLLSTTAFLQSPITSSYASTLDEYLVREIDFNANDRFKKPVKLQLIQGFASLRGKVPAKDGGDRTGTYTWPGGIELGTNIITKNLIDVRDKRVIDLGTGTGVVGLAAILCGAKEVALTDGAVEVLQITERNVASNLNVKLFGKTGDIMNGNAILKSQPSLISSSNAAIPIDIAVGRLRWGNNDDIKKWLSWKAIDQTDKFDVILASEVAYQSKNLQILLDTVKQLINPNGGVAILRLTPEITDDGKGISALIPLINDSGFEIIEYPDIKDSNSQLIKFQVKKNV